MEEHQYGMADLRQYMNGSRPLFAPIPPPPPDLLSGHRTLTVVPTQQHYHEMVMGRGVGHHHHHHHHHQDMVPSAGCGGALQHPEFRSDSSTSTTTPSIRCGLSTGAAIGFGSGGLEMEAGCGLGGGDGGTGRWPRQETLTLLEIRSRLDPKFKEANQKGPLWDEVSRIMSEEHGYQRSGKKCREKFENLYKYYKKTKEGKAGRQDGKHYRFFRQLEALYGDTSNAASVSENHLLGNSVRYNAVANNTTSVSNQEASFQAQKLSDSLSLSNSSDFDTTSSEDSDLQATVDNDSNEKRKKRSKGKRSWKAKIKDFIDSQMTKLMKKQEAWLENMMKTIEQKEQERMLREEDWRKQEAARVEREHRFWANERTWIESRDAAMMEALQKLTGKELVKASTTPDDQELMAAHGLQSMNKHHNDNGSETIPSFLKGDSWAECEITKLIQLRTNMEPRFQQIGCPEEILWEEIAAKMACVGYDRTPLMCKDKWDSVSSYLMKCSKKRKESSRFCCYVSNDSITCQGGNYSCDTNDDQGGPDQTVRHAPQNDQGASPPNGDTGHGMHDGCYRYLMGDAENLWENYGAKFSKGVNQ
nr:trihelix transcription factor PTL-like [Coffea arabica]